MIISASRRTDIPAYYADWFCNRIREGYVCVRNPMNFHQVSRISLSPDVVDGIVFWTKNPLPLMSRLEELRAYGKMKMEKLCYDTKDLLCRFKTFIKKDIIASQ